MGSDMETCPIAGVPSLGLMRVAMVMCLLQFKFSWTDSLCDINHILNPAAVGISSLDHSGWFRRVSDLDLKTILVGASLHLNRLFHLILLVTFMLFSHITPNFSIMLCFR